ncbi:alanyl-tRNA editing protein [archaeon]|jgi:alanyl-tRNA synthetase|nr:alanyl-tRNA editing protein [archaeon]MBT4022655.1 alanyl-tRNA editing protein [archaeon]MBT4272095.1 alanyl-tRNA editing protein [archaeon]MBT4461192.1 alanyl-tRNA editing protein [archaeon]MBT4858801.1 alanyl-tRNA editing protein [archaeon]
MTKKLFWEDPYQTECNAIVTSINENKIKLDQTIFFAFSGGQASDEGTINGIKVINAIKEGDKENIVDIEYELETVPKFKVGEEIKVKINEKTRSNLRKLHSAAHVFYYFFVDTLGRQKIIGSNIAKEKARVDFIYNESLTEKLLEMEKVVNEFLSESHEIITKPDENKPDLKWWNCEEWKMPCGGTHVKNTKEIGQIKLKRKNIGSGKERIEIYLS